MRVAVRLHPLPDGTATVAGATDDPDRLGAAAAALAGQPLEADCLDVDWRDGAGRLLLRFGGAAAGHQAGVAAERVAAAGLEASRRSRTTTSCGCASACTSGSSRPRTPASSRSPGAITDLPAVVRATTEAGGTLVGRAGLGLSWLTVPRRLGGRAPRRAGAARVHDPRRPGALRADAVAGAASRARSR